MINHRCKITNETINPLHAILVRNDSPRPTFYFINHINTLKSLDQCPITHNTGCYQYIVLKDVKPVIRALLLRSTDEKQLKQLATDLPFKTNNFKKNTNTSRMTDYFPNFNQGFFPNTRRGLLNGFYLGALVSSTITLLHPLLASPELAEKNKAKVLMVGLSCLYGALFSIVVGGLFGTISSITDPAAFKSLNIMTSVIYLGLACSYIHMALQLTAPSTNEPSTLQYH